MKCFKNYIRKKRLLYKIWDKMGNAILINNYKYAHILSKRYDKVKNL